MYESSTGYLKKEMAVITSTATMGALIIKALNIRLSCESIKLMLAYYGTIGPQASCVAST